MRIRNMFFSKRGYPKETKQLGTMIETFFHEVRSTWTFSFEKKQIQALIVPHASYSYSGKVASYAYYLLSLWKETLPKTIVLIVPNHVKYAPGICVGLYDAYETPFGNILGNVSLGRYILSKYPHMCFEDIDILEKEHSFEMQFPLLHYVFGDGVYVLPLVVTKGMLFSSVIALFEDLLQNHRVFFIATTDLSHYYEYNEAKRKDMRSIHAILEKRVGEDVDACGRGPIMIVNALSQMYDWNVALLAYGNSGEENERKDRVVGYASFVYFVEEF